MAGELDFARLAAGAGRPCSPGCPTREVEQVRDALRLTPGARTFVRTLRRLGFHVGVVSGGFTVFTDRFVAELGLDFAAANELEVVDGTPDRPVVGPVVDRAGQGRGAARASPTSSTCR